AQPPARAAAAGRGARRAPRPDRERARGCAGCAGDDRAARARVGRVRAGRGLLRAHDRPVLPPLRGRRSGRPARRERAHSLPPHARRRRVMSYYGSADYRYNDDLALRMRDIKKGNLDLGWLKAGTEARKFAAENAKRGLTYMDLNQGSYGYDDMPELPRGPRGAQPRGAAFVPEDQADLEPELNRKTHVGAYKVASFTEEAVSRQWDATHDIPWGDLDKYERSEELEIAFAQLCTFFTEVELIATDLPAKWLWRMNNQFSEVKHFIATQAMDEARHAEVFRKRALAGGIGLMEALPQTEH